MPIFKSGKPNIRIYKQEEPIDETDFRRNLRLPIHENRYFKEVFKAMKQVKKDLDHEIDQQKLILFETNPPDYRRENKPPEDTI